jgi:hypothetical protein
VHFIAPLAAGQRYILCDLAEKMSGSYPSPKAQTYISYPKCQLKPDNSDTKHQKQNHCPYSGTSLSQNRAYAKKSNKTLIIKILRYIRRIQQLNKILPL